VGGVEELAVAGVQVEEHGPELPVHLVVEHEFTQAAAAAAAPRR